MSSNPTSFGRDIARSVGVIMYLIFSSELMPANLVTDEAQGVFPSAKPTFSVELLNCEVKLLVANCKIKRP